MFISLDFFGLVGGGGGEWISASLSFTTISPSLNFYVEYIEKYQRRSPKCKKIFTGLPRPGKNILNMKFFPGQGKVREFCRWPGKFRKDLES